MSVVPQLAVMRNSRRGRGMRVVVTHLLRLLMACFWRFCLPWRSDSSGASSPSSAVKASHSERPLPCGAAGGKACRESVACVQAACAQVEIGLRVRNPFRE